MKEFRRFVGGVIRASAFRFSAFVVLALLGITQDRIVAYVHGGQPAWERVWQTHLAIQIVFIASAFLILAYAFYSYVHSILGPSTEPDMPVAHAINYLVNDSRVKLRQAKAAEIATFGPAKGRIWRQGGVAHNDAKDKILEKAISGELAIWGCREQRIDMMLPAFESHKRPIDKTYWNHATFDWHAIQRVTETGSQTQLLHGVSEYRYSSLSVSRAQIEALWPPLPHWRRVWLRIRGIARVDYWGRHLSRSYTLIDAGGSNAMRNSQGGVDATIEQTEYLQLSAAAQYVYNQTRHSSVMEIARTGQTVGKGDPIRATAQIIFRRVPVAIGCLFGSTEADVIPQDERDKMKVLEDSNSAAPPNAEKAKYVRIHVDRHDLTACIEFINGKQRT